MPTIITAYTGTLFTHEASHMSRSACYGPEELGPFFHLRDRGDIDLLHFGKVVGDLGYDVVEPYIKGLDPWTYGEGVQEAGWAKDIAAIKDKLKSEPVAMLQLPAQSVSCSTVHNPMFTTPLCSSLRTIGPVLNVAQAFDLLRLYINNDPRSYPREAEMVSTHPRYMPAAILDQVERDFKKTVGGVSLRCRSVDARGGSWAHMPPFEWQHGWDYDCVVMSNGHFTTTLRSKAHDAWKTVLSGNCYPVIGEGWESFELYDEDRFEPVTHENKLINLAPRTLCAPIVNHTTGYYTNKPYKLIHYGCIPVLYGNDADDPHCVDPFERWLPLDHPWRVSDAPQQSLAHVVKRLACERNEAREFWRATLVPDWSTLDALVDDIVLRRLDPCSGDWFARYGGYRRSPV